MGISIDAMGIGTASAADTDDAGGREDRSRPGNGEPRLGSGRPKWTLNTSGWAALAWGRRIREAEEEEQTDGNGG